MVVGMADHVDIADVSFSRGFKFGLLLYQFFNKKSHNLKKKLTGL